MAQIGQTKLITVLVVAAMFTFFAASGVYAHEDTLIEVKEGRLTGLPEKYEPASLDLTEKSLRIKDKKVTFPPCVSKYFPEKFDIQVTASWYHKNSDLPPYLNLVIRPTGKDYHYELLFNLDTLDPIHFEIVTHESETSSMYQELVIGERCRLDLTAATRPVAPIADSKGAK